METAWIADRTTLHTLLRHHPDWRHADFAEAVNRSLGWVKKWVKRFHQAPADDLLVVHSRSRAPKHPPARVSAEVVERILDIRDHPPAKLGRIPGPKAILYYLNLDSDLKHRLPLPRSTNTI